MNANLDRFAEEYKQPWVYTKPVLTVEEQCSECECRAKVKVKGVRYCWDCAEVEGVEKA